VRRLRVGALERDAACSERIELRRHGPAVAIGAEVVGAQRVDRHEHDVGARCERRRALATRVAWGAGRECRRARGRLESPQERVGRQHQRAAARGPRVEQGDAHVEVVVERARVEHRDGRQQHRAQPGGARAREGCAVLTIARRDVAEEREAERRARPHHDGQEPVQVVVEVRQEVLVELAERERDREQPGADGQRARRGRTQPALREHAGEQHGVEPERQRDAQAELDREARGEARHAAALAQQRRDRAEGEAAGDREGQRPHERSAARPEALGEPRDEAATERAQQPEQRADGHERRQ
jgi:hypothetical protein